MNSKSKKTRVALVYPPYGPPNLANLGLAILSAGVKNRGFECQTFYWHYRFVRDLPLPGYSMEQKLKAYEMLTRRDFFPWNEWLFVRPALGGAIAERDPEVLERLQQLDKDFQNMVAPDVIAGLSPSQLVLHLCNDSPRQVAAMASELESFDVIGIGSTFFQSGAALALAKHIKERWPEKKTVMGGANCDGEMGRAMIDCFPFLDYVFTGEVDHSFPEFVQALDEGAPIDHIPGLTYHGAEGEVLEGPAANPANDMDSIPVPDFDDYIRERKFFAPYVEGELCLPLESSRGCWWGAKSHCTFCGLNANGMAYRQKNDERFQQEVEEIVGRYNTRYLFMADNILSTKYYRSFVRWAKERDINVDFFYEIKANMDRAQVVDLADAGISMVQPGIESFSTEILALMGKGLRGIQNIAFLKFAEDHGLITAYNILCGFPGEDPSEYERQSKDIRKLTHLRPPNGMAEVEFHRFSPYHNDPEKFGIRLTPHENYFFVFPFSEEVVSRLAYRFALKGRTMQGLSYLQGINHVVADWRNEYNLKGCTLTWRREGDDILIQDRRSGFDPCNYRLQDHATTVYEALDQPKTLKAARREIATLLAKKAEEHGNGNGIGSGDGKGRGAVPISIERRSRIPAAGYAGHPVDEVPQQLAMAAPYAAPPMVAGAYGGLQAAAPYQGYPAAAALAGYPATQVGYPAPVVFGGYPVPQAVPAAVWPPAIPERSISFAREAFERDPECCLQLLVEPGLVYEEDSWYLSLPVAEDHRQIEEGWGGVGF